MVRGTAAVLIGTLLTLTAAPAYADPTGDVRAAMLKLVALSSWEMKGQTTISGRPSAITADFVRPNSMHMTTPQTEMISTGSAVYVRIAGRGWTKIPASPGGANPAAMPFNVRDMTRNANRITATDLGMRSVGGETLHAYRMKDTDGNQTTAYIGSDGFPHRMEGRNGQTVTFGRFNAVPPIRAPI
jgi:hypothetical protein